MAITEKDVNAIAELANLELTSDERTRLVKDLAAILEDIGRLNQLDTSHVEPMAGASALEFAQHSAMRPDELQPCLPHADAMRNAPASDGNFFKVPKVIER